MGDAGFHDHFSGVAAGYAAFRPRYPDDLFAWLAGQAPARNHAWDCACGNGQASVALAEHFAHVTAADASAAQIAHAPTHPRIDWRVATAERSGLDESSVDLVTVAQALHWFDLEAFYAEARRVLAPTGILAVWCYGTFSTVDTRVNALVQSFYNDTVGPYWPPERHIVEGGYRALAFPFTEIAAPPFTLEQDWPLPQLLGYLRSWSATARCREATGRDPVDALSADLRTIWRDAERPLRFTWPLSLRVGRLPS